MDAIVAVISISMLLLAFHLAGLQWWVWFWAGMIALLGLFELAAKLHTGKTLSQQFWAYSLANRDEGLILGIIVIAGGVGLGIHLLWKLIKQLF
jgi:hypothetical protein